MDYQESLDFITGISWRGSKLGLSRTQELLAHLGNPERELKFVHIAGTNGKGSTAAMTASILRAAGYRVGLYTSPAIQDFCERIQVNGEMIPHDALAQLMTEDIRPYVERMADPTTEFEMVTALALLWFKRSKCDIVVLEVGMGGEFDSTNVIPVPEAAVICAIGLDHTAELGGTLAKIAMAKAGIIKPGGSVVSYGNSPEANEVIERVCREHGCELVEPQMLTVVKKDLSVRGQYFSYKHYNDLFLPLVGDYQPNNAAVAIETANILRKKGWAVSDAVIRKGLAEVKWPGRFELVHEEPVFIVDGGHNPQGIRGTVDSLRRLLGGKKPVVLMGVMADKDVDGILALLTPLAARFVTVTPDNPRALPAEKLAEKICALGLEAEAKPSVEAGVARVLELAGKDGAAIALGSLYMVGAVRRCFGLQW